jgi:purine-binding chemotaxis protein CheW
MIRDDHEILKERAGVISGKQGIKGTADNLLLVIEFSLIPEKYAIDGNYVTEVLPLKNLTVIPGTPVFVVGIINLRGKIISVVNLKSFFDLKEKGISALHKVFVIKHEKMEFGILADEIMGTKWLDMQTLSPPPINLHGSGLDYIQGVASDGTILLNARAILSTRSIIVNQK